MAKVGRKKIVNWTETEARLFGRFRATHETLADYYGCCVRTIERLMADDTEGSFCRAYKKALSTTKMKLSEAQLKTAIEDHNATMLVWLGKQYLNQTDKQEIDNTIEVKTGFDKIAMLAQREGLTIESFAQREGISLEDLS